MSTEALLTILGMMAVTMAIRFGGLLLAERLPTTGFIALWLRDIPGAVLASLIAPEFIKGGPAAWLAGVVATLAFTASRNVFVTIVAGVAAIFLARRFLGL